MPTLAHVMGPVHDGLFMQPTDADKLKVLLQEANNVDEPPSVDDVCAFVDLLKKYWAPADGSRELLALNRVVGTRRSVMGAYDHGFLQAQSALPWRHFSRELIALQLIVRIADYKFIDQKDHPLCGPVTFMHGIARRNIEEYALYVIGLAENRRGDLGTHTVKVKSSSNLLGRHAKPRNSNQICEADYIALTSLREGSNIFAYRSASTNRTLEGMSSPASMMQWMRDAGFSNVEDHVHSGWRVHGLRMKADRTNLGRNLMRPHLLKMQQRLANGYTVMLVAADSLANMAREKDHGQSALMRILGGHFMLALSVDVRQDGAAFGLVTWGEEIEPKIEIPWSKIASWYRGFVCGQP
jgi:hypothetical protein